MAAKYDKVIIFGPTGDVGSATALEASKRGAKVWLAMRDTEKSIRGIDPEQEQQGLFTRVKADLADPASVKAAVEKSGAKAAYMYLVFTPAGLKATIEAMKEAGIEYVVFLSSFTIGRKDARQVTMADDIIAFGHAQVEVAIEDSGMALTTLRPGFFASNSLRQNLDRSTNPWQATLLRNAARWDNISPLDMGRVAGTVLVNRPSTSATEVIPLFGPQLLSQDEMWDAIQKAANREIRLIYLSPDEYKAYMVKKGMPPVVVELLVKQLQEITGDEKYPEGTHSEGVASIEKYSGYKPQSFSEYLADQFP